MYSTDPNWCCSLHTIAQLGGWRMSGTTKCVGGYISKLSQKRSYYNSSLASLNYYSDQHIFCGSPRLHFEPHPTACACVDHPSPALSISCICARARFRGPGPCRPRGTPNNICKKSRGIFVPPFSSQSHGESRALFFYPSSEAKALPIRKGTSS